jgi:DNA polymerase I-like protein with 3'-5' exonuclease and polymerase domains/phage/plasmid-associated DNA primase
VANDWTDGPQLADPCAAMFAGSMVAATEPLDLAGCSTDRSLAQRVLEHARGRVRFLSDVDHWITYTQAGPDTPGDWSFSLGLSADAEARVLLNRSLDWALRGDATADKGTDEHARFTNRNRLSMAAGAGAAASMMLAIARDSGFPGRVRLADLDRTPGVLWAGGTPWDLAASVGRLVRADLDPRTPHLRTAGYTPKLAPTPKWDRFLAAVFPTEQQREWALTLLGGVLVGRGAKVLLLLQGAQDTGKTQLLTLVSDLLGTGDRGYATAADRKLLSDDTAHASILMQLAGRRLAWVDESPRSGKASIERLKALTGGGYMTANHMRTDPVTFRPTHTLALTTNSDPEVSDAALRSRIRLVKLDNDTTDVAHTRAALGDIAGPTWQTEAPSVLGKLITYAARWIENPDRGANLAGVQAELEAMAAEQDVVAQWVIEQTVREGWTASSSLYEAFRIFARGQGIPDHRIDTANAFGRSLTRLGVPRQHTRGGKAWELSLRRFKGPDLTGVFGPSSSYTDGPAGPENRPAGPVTDSGDGFPPVPAAIRHGQPAAVPSGDPCDGIQAPAAPGDGLRDGLRPPAKSAPTRADARSVTDVTDSYPSSTQTLKTHTKTHTHIRLEEVGEKSVTSVTPAAVALPAIKARGAAPKPANLDAAAAVLVGMIAAPGGRLTLDVEHTGYPVGHPDYQLRTVQLGDANTCVVLDARDPQQLALATRALDAAETVHAHSATADIIPTAIAAGVDPAGWWDKTADTGIMAALNPPERLGNPQSWGLKDLAKLLPDPQTDKADKARAAMFRAHKWLKDTEPDTPTARNGWYQVSPDEPVMVDYAASDVLDTHALADLLAPGVPDAPGLLDRERAVQRIVSRVTHRGILLDPDLVAQQLNTHTEAAALYAARLAAGGIANPSSNPQITKALQAAGVRLPATAAGNLSAAKDVLEALAPADADGERPRTGPGQALVADLLDYRHHNTLLTLFLRGFDLQARHGDGRVRPTVLTMGAAATGRMSCTRPNLQQIPREGGMREMFLADPGQLIVSADFSSVEVRVAAWVSGDLGLAAMLRDGLDLHSLVAEKVWGPDYTKAHRYAAKRAVFGWIYGAGLGRVALQLGTHGDKAQAVVDAMAQITPGLVQWGDQLRADVRAGRRPYWQHGSGRITWLPAAEPHKAVNYVVQSTARELLVEALLRLETAAPGLTVLPVHDEPVTFADAADAPRVRQILAEAMSFSLPMPDGQFVPIVAEPAEPATRWWSST